jgi:hypothetical protein
MPSFKENVSWQTDFKLFLDDGHTIASFVNLVNPDRSSPVCVIYCSENIAYSLLNPLT